MRIKLLIIKTSFDILKIAVRGVNDSLRMRVKNLINGRLKCASQVKPILMKHDSHRSFTFELWNIYNGLK